MQTNDPTVMLMYVGPFCPQSKQSLFSATPAWNSRSCAMFRSFSEFAADLDPEAFDDRCILSSQRRLSSSSFFFFFFLASFSA